MGARTCIKECIREGYKSVLLCYDYEGIENFATGSWKARSEHTQQYADTMKMYGELIDIEFLHTDAHTGIEGNEAANVFAQEAVGLLSSNDVKVQLYRLRYAGDGELEPFAMEQDTMEVER